MALKVRLMEAMMDQMAGGRLTPNQIDAFAREGVVYLPHAFERKWVEMLQVGVERNLVDPGPRARVYNRTSEGKVFRYDSDNWLRFAEYEQFVRESCCAEIAAQLMQSEKSFLFFDAIFVRSEGQQFRTPWHQDEPYWSIEGFQTVGIWMPLVPVEKKSALMFIPGSHRWEQKYRQKDFAELNPDGQKVESAQLDGEGWLPLPDFDADPQRWRITSWDMEPGDCVAFNGRTFHGGGGLLSHDRNLKVFNTKWAGDDVRVAFRPRGMQPDHTDKMIAAGMKHGDPLNPEVYPLLWPRAS